MMQSFYKSSSNQNDSGSDDERKPPPFKPNSNLPFSYSDEAKKKKDKRKQEEQEEEQEFRASDAKKGRSLTGTFSSNQNPPPQKQPSKPTDWGFLRQAPQDKRKKVFGATKDKKEQAPKKSVVPHKQTANPFGPVSKTMSPSFQTSSKKEDKEESSDVETPTPSAIPTSSFGNKGSGPTSSNANVLMSKLQQTPAKIKERHPQMAQVPDSWFARMTSSNKDGPPVTLAPSPQPSDDEAEEEQPSGKFFGVDFTKDVNLKFKESEVNIPLTKDEEFRTRSEVRSTAMLMNAYIDATKPLSYKNPKDLEKEAKALRKLQRKNHPSLYPKSQTVVSHVPDSSYTQVPYSPMGWLPQSSHANTLQGSGHQGYMSNVSAFHVKERSGRWTKPTFESRQARKEREKKKKEDKDESTMKKNYKDERKDDEGQGKSSTTNTSWTGNDSD